MQHDEVRGLQFKKTFIRLHEMTSTVAVTNVYTMAGQFTSALSSQIESLGWRQIERTAAADQINL
jgi:hypothetical protein